MKKDELEKLGFELSDLLPRLEMIQHASYISSPERTLNKRTQKYTQTTLKSVTGLIFNHRDVITTKEA